ncbi:MAG: hypothetical protein JO076_00140 [Verrucomicrobia bacterium]|nr:hypothetical protein [Verrucomicrobiota bacterium]
MANFYQHLAAALRERFVLIADRELREKDPTEQLSRLRQVSERIQKLTEQLPQNADPMLAHYLERMSFSKALEFVESRYLT